MADAARSVRVAELTIALSLASDLGTGQPMEHGLRTCWLSLAAAEALGVGPEERSSVYHVALLRFIGCTSDAAATAALAGGDDLAFNAAMAPMLMADSGAGTRYFLRHLAEDLPVLPRMGRIVRALSDPGMAERSLSGHCEVAARLAGRLGLPEPIPLALGHAYERWDGKGYPDGLAGEDVPFAVRVVTVARDVELWSREAGWADTHDVLARRRGRGYDPDVVDAFVEAGPTWLSGVGDDPCAQVLAAEPEPVLTLHPDQLDRALSALADFADMKSPFFLGHSTGVARLVSAAAGGAGLGDQDAAELGRAALVHDLGVVGVSSGTWDRPGPLSPEQWERVRMHPHLTERILLRCGLLAPLAGIAGRHHERADGSGYHRSISGDRLAIGERLLAAADTYHALTEVRPHRPGRPAAAAASELLDESDSGRWGRREVEAVIEAAGETTRVAHVNRPAGLTEREVDVLGLLARGQTNKQVADTLGISPRTVGTHVEHIYAKAGVRTRAGATLFALEHGLVRVGDVLNVWTEPSARSVGRSSEIG